MFARSVCLWLAAATDSHGDERAERASSRAGVESHVPAHGDGARAACAVSEAVSEGLGWPKIAPGTLLHFMSLPATV